MILRRVQQSLACFGFEESLRCEEHACTSCLTLAQLELGGNSINEVNAVRGVNSGESINIASISSSRCTPSTLVMLTSCDELWCEILSVSILTF